VTAFFRDAVLAGLTKPYDRFHLKIKDAKTAVAPALRRKFLGYAFWYGSGGQVNISDWGVPPSA